MSGKKISIGAKPITKPNPDAWVESRSLTAETNEETPAEETAPAEAPAEEKKRLTIDIPVSLHRAIKSQTGARGTKIADEVREMLAQKYGNTEIIK